MKLLPSEKVLKKWILLVPTEGDLVFFRNRAESLPFQNLGVPLYTQQEAKIQSPDLLGLNQRSWYGYSLGKSAFCMKMPRGLIESLSPDLQKKLLQIQLKIKVPTVLKNTKRSPLWLTAQTWSKFSLPKKIDLFRKYLAQNPKVEVYSKTSLDHLSSEAKATLKSFRLGNLAEPFASHSGPNCFGLVAQIISKSKVKFANNWLHWAPLKRFLDHEGYRKVKITAKFKTRPQIKSGDVLIFMQGRYALHGCVALDAHFVIEKPGQDFYEPYMISPLKKTRQTWRTTQLQVWRKTSSPTNIKPKAT